MKYDGCRILFLRKTRASLTESALALFESKVLPDDSSVLLGPARTHRHAYVYPNGSMIVCGGLDNVERLMSSEYDMVCLFEATEATVEDWEKCLTRLRNGKIPDRQQAIADCNPSYPSHWLKERAERGQMTRIMSRHADNPTLTKEYLERLSKLTGHRYNRLFLGQWCAAEGLIYDRFDEAVHVQEREAAWMQYDISIDEGYSNPCSMHLYATDNDDRIHVVDEFYKTGQLESAIVTQAKIWCDRWPVGAILVDPSAAKLIAALQAAGLSAIPADNDVYGGILRVQERLNVVGDSRPRLTVSPNCKQMIREFSAYSWASNADGSKKDTPLKRDDHAMDDLRYLVAYIDRSTASMEVFTI